jgi:hypothetical protein
MVQVQAATIRGDLRGVGLLVDVEGTSGFVITAKAVVQQGSQPSRRVECVFGSGQAARFTTRAAVRVVEPEGELAVLEVRRPQLPSPLPPSTIPRLRPGTSVFAVGFPAVADDAGSQREQLPVTTAARLGEPVRDENGLVVGFEINGQGLERGSPVLNENGDLAGMVVPAGQDTFQVVLADSMRDLLNGRVGQVTIAGAELHRRRVEYEFDVTLLDPRGQIRAVFVHTAPASAATQPPPRNRDGSWRPVAAKMRAHKLAVAKGHATGTVYVEARRGEPAAHVYQLRYLGEASAPVFTQPALLEVTPGTTNEGQGGEGTPARDRQPESAAAEAARPKRTVPEVPRPNAKLASAGLAPIRLPEASIRQPLPGAVTGLAVGGAGRFFVIQCAGQKDLAVFDLMSGQIEQRIPAPDNAVLAASVNMLFVISPSDSTIARWSLDRFRQEATAALAVEGSVRAAATGHSSAHGPLLVQTRSTTEPLIYSTLVHPKTLQPDASRSAWLARRGRKAPLPTRDDGSFSVPLPFGGDLTCCASACGNVFGIWSAQQAQGMTMILDEQTVMCCVGDARFGHLMPMPDGTTVCTARGYASSDLSQGRDVAFCLPSYHPYYFISLQIDAGGRARGRIHDIGQRGRPVHDLPIVEGMVAVGPRNVTGQGLLPEQRYHYVPQAGILVTIPASDDQLVLQQVDFQAAPIPAQLVDTTVVPRDRDRQQPREVSMGPRIWTDRSGEFTIEARFVSRDERGVHLETTDGRSISVPLGKLSREDINYVRQVLSRQQTQKEAQDAAPPEDDSRAGRESAPPRRP